MDQGGVLTNFVAELIPPDGDKVNHFEQAARNLLMTRFYVELHRIRELSDMEIATALGIGEREAGSVRSVLFRKLREAE